MGKDSFYQKQNKLTAAKIKIYKDYIQEYLFKLLMSYGECFIADLFCGTGSNGNKPGSPMVLIEDIKYTLTSEKIKNNNPKVFVLFNDEDCKCVEKLECKIREIEIPQDIILWPSSKEFHTILNDIKNIFSARRIPKFFFLDPFTYSSIKMDDVKSLIELNNSEVLLFLPVFHSYRFAGNKTMRPDHKTRLFLEEFTVEGVYDYPNIDCFIDSIRNKLKKELRLDYVRPVLLNDGSRKNALFLITKRKEGALLMSKIAFKYSNDGSCINIGREKEQSLFGVEITSKFLKFEADLIKKIKKHKNISNLEIIDYTISECFLPKHAAIVIKKIKKQGLIKIIDEKNKEIKNIYIAEKTEGKSFIRCIQY